MQKYKLGKHEVRVCGKAVETDATRKLKFLTNKTTFPRKEF